MNFPNANRNVRPEDDSGRTFISKRAQKRARLIDRFASVSIRLGGAAIVFCVIGILVLIVSEALPLFIKSDAKYFSQQPVQEEVGQIKAVGLSDDLESYFTVSKQGQVNYYDSTTNELLDSVPMTSAHQKSIMSIETDNFLHWSVLWSDGSSSIVKILSGKKFNDTGQKESNHGVRQLAEFSKVSQCRYAQSAMQEEGAIRVSDVDFGGLKIHWNVESESLFGDVTFETVESDVELESPVIAMALNTSGTRLACATQDKKISVWDVGQAGRVRLIDQVDQPSMVTSLQWLIGGNSLACGRADGSLDILFMVNATQKNNKAHYLVGHSLKRHQGEISDLIASPRFRALMSLDATGLVSLDFSTSESRLFDLYQKSYRVARFNQRGTGVILLTQDNEINIWQLDIPHPEATLNTLFSEVWYENYPEPDYVWQSSSGTDDFEPKISLIPLIFGTLKGAIYAMIFAVPLALMGAIYTSQFASHRFRRFVKPGLEILGAVPTVVIGFLAALWLAPRLESHLISVLTGFIVLPGSIVLGIFIWSYIRQFNKFDQLEQKREWWFNIPGIAIGVFGAMLLGPWVEEFFFSGDFKLWLFETTGQSYDPRNCFGVSLALGFAVLPLIFTIAEDAISAVPSSISAASLALGASRWQTVFSVVLPSASSGIIAAFILGLGRAIGETMIVLMATGNTPIIDVSPFNGMRTLSANIAVEIPEAPVDGTLFRVLFLSAVVLFVFTSVLNMTAEYFRYRLRKKLGSESS